MNGDRSIYAFMHMDALKGTHREGGLTLSDDGQTYIDTSLQLSIHCNESMKHYEHKTEVQFPLPYILFLCVEHIHTQTWQASDRESRGEIPRFSKF